MPRISVHASIIRLRNESIRRVVSSPMVCCLATKELRANTEKAHDLAAPQGRGSVASKVSLVYLCLGRGGGSRSARKLKNP